MFKKLVWTFLAKATNSTFEEEYMKTKSTEEFLKNLISHVYKNVPYYQSIFEKTTLIKDDQLSLTDFHNLPLLTKDIVRKHESDLTSRDLNQRKWFYNTSGGSTGEPLRFIQDQAFSKWITATTKYYYEDMLDITETFAKKIIIWAFPREDGLVRRLRTRTNHALTNTKVLDCLRMNEADMERYIRFINAYRPEVVRGYANALYEISRLAERKKLAIHTPAVLVSSAEVLSEDWREKIEAVFGTKVFDFYGSREVDGIAGECKAGRFHIFTFNNYVEVVDSRNNIVKEGEKGKVIITSLHNYSMPFIRYDIGDMAIQGPEKCECGNLLPTLVKVIGRICCFFRKEDGTLVDDGYFIGLLAEQNWIKTFRIVQEDYTRIRIFIVPKDGTIKDSDTIEIENGIRSMMGKDCKLIWETVDEIPKTRLGKYVYTQSLIEP